jgi:hypothetical protein
MKNIYVYIHAPMVVPVGTSQEIILSIALLNSHNSKDILYLGRNSAFGKSVLCRDGFLSNCVELSDCPFLEFDWGMANHGTSTLARAVASHLTLGNQQPALEQRLYQEFLHISKGSSWCIFSAPVV